MAPDAPAAAAPGPDGPESDLVAFLARALASPDPRFLLITGRVGAGKSTLVRTLIPTIRGPRLFIAYQNLAPASPVAGGPAGPNAPPVPMLLVDPQVVADGPESAGDAPIPESSPRSTEPGVGISGPLAEAVARARTGGPVTIVVDSWDRSSEALFRSQARSPSGIRSFSTPATEILALQSSILSDPNHLVLGVLPELGAQLTSLADVVVQLETEPTPSGPIGVCSVPKARVVGSSPDRSLYSADGRQFRSLSPLPSGFRPKLAPPEADPEPGAETGWPGSSAFAGAYGRLRFGGMTGIAFGPETPDTVPLALAAPFVGEVLSRGGRAAWIPSPEVRPARLIALLREVLPDGWIRERLRLLSATPDDPGVGDFRSTILPIARDVGRPTEAPGSTGVGPLFPAVYRFLRDRSAGTPALYVVSLEGLRAVLTAAGRPLEPTTLPSVAGSYTRLPRYHMFAHGLVRDPITSAMMPMADTVLQGELVHGRPVLFGVRPKRPPMVLDWPADRPGYVLLPATV